MDMDWVAKLNKSAARGEARVTYEGAEPFGNDTLRRFQLGNGMKILVLVDRSAPVVSYHTWFNVGSRHEKKGKTGLAHFFEHLMFKETEEVDDGAFDRILEENGAESNAATWVDWTYYYEALPADRLQIAIDLEAGRMGKLVLQEEQVASEREVVTNERRMRVEDDVEGAANELLYKLAFTKHPYHWPVLGWMEDIQGYSPADCQAFYKTYYAPNNATVVVVGDVDEEALLRKIRDGYGVYPRSSIPPEDIEPEPPQVEARVVEIAKPTATEKLIVAFQGPALGDHDHMTLTVLDQILFGGRASRVYRSLVVEKELATEVRSAVSPFKDPGLYETYVTARGAHTTKEIEAVLDAELAKVRDEVVSDAELQRAQARLELGLLQSLETMGGKAESIGFYETVLGDPTAGFRRLEASRRVTAADIRRVARRYLVDRARTIVRVVPERAKEAAE